ncbi:MAG: GH1 family beta-glucosidase [Phycisphaerales bacterium]
MRFPDGFLWGAATSAYQIEGAVEADGAGASIYEPFCRRPGAVFGGHSGAVACDHYRRFSEDVAWMSRIGLKAYRFSISWPRVLPEGIGRVNHAGIAFYERLVDALLDAGIEPWATLFHWDFPQSLQLRGGWFNRDSAEWFAELVAAVVDRLSDRVSRWMTINEPQVFLKFGYGDGTIAPGLKVSLGEQLIACHNALRAHGRGVQVVRARARKPPTVGWAMVGRTDFPASDDPHDIEAARRGMMQIREPNLWNNTWYADAAILGRYPEDGLRIFRSAGAPEPPVQPGDMTLISQRLDFYGVNIYDGRCVRADPDGQPRVVPFAPGHPQNAFRWFVTPPALRWGPRLIHERYNLPVYITENGFAGLDWVAADGAVHDPQRIDYTRRYLIELRRAITDGADIRGYFHWSLLDNFEWAEGYSQRFGLIHVDYATQQRTPKDSALWYRRVIESNGDCLRE